MPTDLNDAELDQLADLLAATPEPLQPVDVPMLDGYLAGVLVQPRLVSIDEWLPPVFDFERRPLPESNWSTVKPLVERLNRHTG
ncbi:MAG: YecA family protein [Aquincola sp.]|nr:YecA family protein [Aquincola sp.]